MSSEEKTEARPAEISYLHRLQEEAIKRKLEEKTQAERTRDRLIEKGVVKLNGLLTLAATAPQNEIVIRYDTFFDSFILLSDQHRLLPGYGTPAIFQQIRERFEKAGYTFTEIPPEDREPTSYRITWPSLSAK